MSKVVEELNAHLKRLQAQQDADEFRWAVDEHLAKEMEERISRAKENVAAKSNRGRPLPKSLLHVKPSPERPQGSKICKNCKRKRPLVLFPPRWKFKEDGERNVLCQLCLNTKIKQLRNEGGPDFSDRRIVARPLPTLKQRSMRMHNSSRLRAWRLNVPFSLTQQWIENRLKVGKCEVTGLRFSDYGKLDGYTASIDRVVPEKGYTEENCKMVVWIYNAAKGKWSHEDVLRVAKALLEVEAVRAELRKGDAA